MRTGEVPIANISACDGNEVLAQLLWNRGVCVLEDVKRNLRAHRHVTMPPPHMLYSPESVREDCSDERSAEISVELGRIDEKFLRDLYRLAAICAGDPDPVFISRNVRLVNVSAIGLSRRHTRLIIEGESGDQLSGNWWDLEPSLVPKGRGDVTYCIRIDDRLGRLEVRAEVIGFKPGGKSPAHQRPPILPEPYTIVDWRGVANPSSLVSSLDNVQIWAENTNTNGVIGCRRDEIIPNHSLVIWTRPPCPEVLRYALERARPEQVWVCAPPFTSPLRGEFLRDLGSLCKAVLTRRAGRIDSVELVGRMGLTEGAVIAGLKALESKGVLRYRLIEERVLLEEGNGERRQGNLRRNIDEILGEIAAYRRYFEVAAMEELFQAI